MSQPGFQPGPYPAWAPQPPQPSLPIRPSLWWIAVGIVIAVAGFLSAFAIGFGGDSAGLSDRVEHLQRVQVPGAGDLQLHANQDYLGYIEFDGASSTALQDEVTVTLVDPAGHPIPVGNPGPGSSYYQTAGREGRSAFAFHTDLDGTYHLTADGPAGTTVAVGTDVSPGLVTSILVFFLIIGASFIAGAAIVVGVILRRDRYRRRLVIAAATATPPGQYGN